MEQMWEMRSVAQFLTLRAPCDVWTVEMPIIINAVL
jgi:hypothetical protein